MKRKGKLWIRMFPDKSVTARPPETRMGKGKGAPEYWVATVRPGNILFELDGVSESVARESLRSGRRQAPHPHQVPHPPPRRLVIWNSKKFVNKACRTSPPANMRTARGRSFHLLHPAAEWPASKSRANSAPLRREIARHRDGAQRKEQIPDQGRSGCQAK